MELSTVQVLSPRDRNSFVNISITWSSDKQCKSLQQNLHNSEQQVTSVNLLQWQKLVKFHTSLVFCSHNWQLLLHNHTKVWHFHNSANHKHLQHNQRRGVHNLPIQIKKRSSRFMTIMGHPVRLRPHSNDSTEKHSQNSSRLLQ